MDSSTRAVPSSTIPSTGIFSPGRTRSLSPRMHRVERHISVASVRERAARSSAQVRAARESPRSVWLRARNSSTWPSSTSVVITAAASKYVATLPSASRNDAGNIPGARTATRLNPYAALVPIAISVNIFNFHRTIERDAALKKRPAAPQDDRRREEKLNPRDFVASKANVASACRELNPTLPSEIQAWSARRSPKIGASWKSVRRSVARRASPCAAPAPFRKSDSFPACRAQFPDASGKRIAFLRPAWLDRRPARAPFRNPDTAEDFRRRERSRELPDASDMCIRRMYFAGFLFRVSVNMFRGANGHKPGGLNRNRFWREIFFRRFRKFLSASRRAKINMSCRHAPLSRQRARDQPSFRKLDLVRDLICRPLRHIRISRRPRAIENVSSRNPAAHAHTPDIIALYDTGRSEVSPAIADHRRATANACGVFKYVWTCAVFTLMMPGRWCDLNMTRRVCANTSSACVARRQYSCC